MEQVDEIDFPPGMPANEPWAMPRERCDTCADDGWIVVLLRVDVIRSQKVGPFDEMAPCPDCRLGYVIQYGWRKAILERKNKPAETVYRRHPSGWEDYWPRHASLRADAVEKAKRRNQVTERPRQAEDARRWKALQARLDRSTRGEDPGIDNGSGSLRDILVTDEAIDEYAILMTEHYEPPSPRDVAAAAGLKVTAGDRCPDCDGGPPLYSYGNVKACGACCVRRAKLALAAGQTPPSGVWESEQPLVS